MRFPEPQRTEIDGVPVWYTDVPGPCLAGLVFRVGQCDETLAIGGVTHLVEHLALASLSSARLDMNGSVGMLTTTFHVAGSQDEAERFLAEVCRSLSDLHLDRLDLERRILRTEALRSGGSPGGSLSARFGAGSFGLVDWYQFGPAGVTKERVESWCRTWFHASQATVWMTRPPSAGLRLPLSDAAGIPPPPPVPSPHLVTPSHLHGSGHTVSCSVVARRTMPLYAALAIARQRVFDELRLERGLSYSTYLYEDRLGPDHSLLTLSTDVAEGHETDGIARFVAILESVASGEASTEEVERACQSSMPWSSNDPSRPAFEAARMAVGDLIGHEPTTWAELERQASEVGPPSVGAALTEALDTGLLVVPDDAEPVGRFSAEPAEVPSRRVQGRLYVRWDGNRVDEVVAGPTGVSRTMGWSVSSVSYEDCVAVILAPRGSMWMIGRWGSEVSLDLNQLRHGHELAKTIRERVGDRFIDLEEDAIGWFSLQTAIESHDVTSIAEMWQELELLATHRLAGERILSVAIADHRGRGIVAVTDQRLLHVSTTRADAQFLWFIRTAISAVRVSSGLRGARLQVVIDSRTYTFDRVRPRSQAAEFELILSPLGDEPQP